MKKAIIFLLFTYSCMVYASSVSCMASGMEIYFINGVWNSEEDVRGTIKRIQDVLNSKFSTELVKMTKYRQIYNQSHGTIADLIELDLEIQSNGQLTNGKDLEAYFTRKIIDNGVKKKKSTSQRFPQKEADAKVIEGCQALLMIS